MNARRLRNLYPFYVLCIAILWSSCRKDFEYQESSGNLTFSKDTVYLDTIFTTIGSSTYTLKVYNPSHTDIQIPSITLKNFIMFRSLQKTVFIFLSKPLLIFLRFLRMSFYILMLFYLILVFSSKMFH